MNSGFEALFSVALFALLVLVLWRPITHTVSRSQHRKQPETHDLPDE